MNTTSKQIGKLIKFYRNTETHFFFNGGPRSRLRELSKYRHKADYKETEVLKSCHSEFHHISFGVDFIKADGCHASISLLYLPSSSGGKIQSKNRIILNHILMKTVKESLLERTSVRRYEREAIPAETMQLIYDAVRNTPTSYNGQQFSVIDIDDQDLKLKLYELTNQKQIKTCNRLLIFCADYNKITCLAERKGFDVPSFTNTMDGVIIGVIDAALAMMSAVVAAQSAGLGSNCIGYLRTVDPAAVAELLKLPKGVFVVCGLALGVPREQPDLKPKEPQQLVFMRNEYRQDTDAMVDEMEAYDEVVKQYNRTRAGGTSDNDWCDHILDYYRHAMDYRILDYLRDQGYNIER